MPTSHDVDTVIIGSGAGGLAAAVALAQAGQKVLVLEQHYLPGGWCHSFTLDKYRFSPGVHYIGALEPGGLMRAVYDGLGVSGDIRFRELNPDGYDHILVAGERFDIPKGKERYERRLIERFPAERDGIRDYLDTCGRLARELDQMLDLRGLKDALLLPLRAPTMARWGLRTARALIDRHVRDPRLRAILAGQSGDHGLPPSLCPAPLHAAVVAHYYEGGWYPEGGGAAIPRAFIRALRKAGGEIRVSTPVDRILLEDGRAIGVRLGDGQEIRARHVISNADPHITFLRLIGEEHLSRGLRRKLHRTRYSVSALSLFAATDLDPTAAGLDSGNYWYYAHDDVDTIYKQGLTASGLEHDVPPGMFLTIPSLKDPTKLRHHPGHHTIESFAFVGFDAFKRWAGSRYGDRPDDYQRLKSDLTARMIRGADRIWPGLAEHLVFSDLGTPLTNLHYVAATDGNLYGTDKTRGQVGPFGFQIGTEFRGLRMVGASTLSHGVLGATMTGLAAAAGILRIRTRELLRSHPAESPPMAAVA